MFSNGIIFQSLTSTITKSKPFFAEVKMFSISAFDNTLNFLPTFFPFGFEAESLSRMTYFAEEDG